MIYRRYCLLKRLDACAFDTGFEPFWLKRQLDAPGTALPADFPLLDELAAIHYVALEDLDGASEEELIDAGLAPQYAQRVMEAYCALTST